jgi:hypothetical protein
MTSVSSPPWQPQLERIWRCRCGRPVFFRNSQCLACGAPLGYDAARGELLPLEPVAGAPGEWVRTGAVPPQRYRRCANFDTAAGCNWLVPVPAAGASPPARCAACRLNRTIPDLSVPGNAALWHAMEVAKRRLVSQLIGLGLPVASKLGEDPQHGLAFDFLHAAPGQPVTTGHADGVITLDVQEADDAHRERVRSALHEPYRTLLGHLRHEVGHYYWQRLVQGTPWQAPFRVLFGDEQADYAAALKAHYDQGPPADWALRHVTAYASSHPWEDWAETFAHYLHMLDTLDTAASVGLQVDAQALGIEPWAPAALWQPADEGAAAFIAFVNQWVALTAALNEMSRSMGLPDFYPFVLSQPAVAKLQLVHRVVRATPGTPASAP